MTKGKLSKKANHNQSRVENPMALLGSMLARLEHDSLRVRQAIRRNRDLHDLLGRVLEDHERISTDIRDLQGQLRKLWEDGQTRRWD